MLHFKVKCGSVIVLKLLIPDQSLFENSAPPIEFSGRIFQTDFGNMLFIWIFFLI